MGLFDGLKKKDTNNSEDAQKWYTNGLELLHLGRFEEAVQAFDKAIKRYPQNAAAWNDKGAALCGLGRYEEAIQALDKAT